MIIIGTAAFYAVGKFEAQDFNAFSIILLQAVQPLVAWKCFIFIDSEQILLLCRSNQCYGG